MKNSYDEELVDTQEASARSGGPVIRVGDLVYGFKGYQRVTKIERRFASTNPQYRASHEKAGDEINAIVHHQEEFDIEGNPISGGKVYWCAIEFFTPAVEALEQQIQHLEEVVQRLKALRHRTLPTAK